MLGCQPARADRFALSNAASGPHRPRDARDSRLREMSGSLLALDGQVRRRLSRYGSWGGVRVGKCLQCSAPATRINPHMNAARACVQRARLELPEPYKNYNGLPSERTSNF